MREDHLNDLLWSQAENRVYISKEQYLQSLDGWSRVEHEVSGEMVGVVLTRGPELHFVTFGKKWNLTRADIRNYLLPLLEKFGYVETKTPKDDVRQRRFNRIVGFEESGEDEFFVHYKMKRLRHA